MLCCGLECKAARSAVVGQHRGCFRLVCAASERLVPRFMGCVRPLLPRALPASLPLASRMETRFLNFSRGRRGLGVTSGPLTIWRPVRAAPDGLLAHPSAQFQLEVGCPRGSFSSPDVRISSSGWQFRVPTCVREPPGELFGAFLWDRPPSSSCCRGSGGPPKL